MTNVLALNLNLSPVASSHEATTNHSNQSIVQAPGLTSRIGQVALSTTSWCGSQGLDMLKGAAWWFGGQALLSGGENLGIVRTALFERELFYYASGSSTCVYQANFS